MSDCFWTDFVGCYDPNCTPPPPPTWAGTAFGEGKVYVDVVVTSPANALVVDSGDVMNTNVDAIILKRIDWYIGQPPGCNQSYGIVYPPWFPSGFSSEVPLYPGVTTPSISKTELNVSLPKTTYRSNGAPAHSGYLISQGDLATALGVDSSELATDGNFVFVAYFEVDANNGDLPYYGAAAWNSCN